MLAGVRQFPVRVKCASLAWHTLRAAAFTRHWTDPGVAALIAVRGGFGSAHLLPLLDRELIVRTPKVFIGYSDNTSLLSWLTCQCGLTALHGPMLERRLAHGEQAYDSHSFLQLMQGQGEGLRLTPDGLTVVQPGEAAGMLFGGTITQLVGSLGTPFAFDPPVGSVLFLEDVHERLWCYERTFENDGQICEYALPAPAVINLPPLVKAGPDVAILVKNKASGKLGVAIFHREIEDVGRHHLPAHALQEDFRLLAPFSAGGFGHLEPLRTHHRDGEGVAFRDLHPERLLHAGGDLQHLRAIRGRNAVPGPLRDHRRANERREPHPACPAPPPDPHVRGPPRGAPRIERIAHEKVRRIRLLHFAPQPAQPVSPQNHVQPMLRDAGNGATIQRVCHAPAHE